MIDGIPGYVSVTFILTTFLTIGFLFYAIKKSVPSSAAAKLVAVAVAFWLFFTASLAAGGFYLKPGGFPPRFLLVPVPAVLFIVFLFLFFRKSFIEKLPLKWLTLLHIVRIPVEITLFWLYVGGMVPQIMTFEGRNFDILSGISAPVIYWLAFRKETVSRGLLLFWNLACLCLLANIVITAVLSIQGEFQQFGFTQPNRAVLFFPYIWLPAIVVPIVLFAHLTSFLQLIRKQ